VRTIQQIFLPIFVVHSQFSWRQHNPNQVVTKSQDVTKELIMRKYLLSLSALLMLQAAPQSFAGDLGINVILSGEVKPGIYGQVQLGNTPRPVVVYDQPRVIVVDKRYIHEEPIYLHVPPGHARHWSKHCREYHACEHRVYFVRSQEYERDYHHEHEHEHHHPKGHKHGKGHHKH
jgi:hypothetical protein